MSRSAAALALLLAGCAAIPPQAARPADPEPLTAFVVIDDASIATLGAFPVDRAVYARAILAAKALGAKGVALKFFLDRPGRPESDAALARAERELPVLLQVEAAQGAQQRHVTTKLVREDWNLARTPQPLSMAAVDLPIAPLEGAAHGLGFVDARLDAIAHKVEVAGSVDGRAIGSLALAIVELAMGHRAIVADNRLQLGMWSFPLDAQGRIACDSFSGPRPRHHGIDALLAGTIPREAIEGKVVVLGYLRHNSPALDVAGAKVPVHEAFYRQVACLARKAGGR